MRRCDVHERAVYPTGDGAAYERCDADGTWATPLTWRDVTILIWLCKEHHERSMEEVKA